MRSISTIFLDDGGAISDNAARALEWQRLVGDFLAPRMGGDHAAWAEANRIVFECSWQRYLDAVRRIGRDGYLDYWAFWQSEHERWFREMCEHVGVPAPGGNDACRHMARETNAYVIPRVRAAFPGVVETIHKLDGLGYRLSTASGESSYELEGYLGGMGVRQLFAARLYGPDLVNTPKDSARFYQRIFADAGVAPADTLVVDDSPPCVQRAALAGAATVLISSEAPRSSDAHAVINSLAELPPVLRRTQRSP